MATVKLAYVDRFRDPRGAWRYYFRRNRTSRRVPLPGRPGDPEFMGAYQLAIAAFCPVGPLRSLAPAAGTVDALAVAYYRSPNFLSLKVSTQKTYRREIDRWREKNGTKRVVQLQRRHIMDQMAARHADGGPEAANNLLRVVRLLCSFAVENDWRRDNPALGIKKFKMRGDGFVAWSEDDIAKYLKHWKAGTRERLALLLLLYTGQRRSDVIQMGRQHVSADTIRVKQGKTGAHLVIPMHPDLRGVLKKLPKDGLAFLTTQYGTPFKDGASFGNQFGGWCKAAGLNGRSAHGLRKSAAVRLVEAGCSSKEVAAITGHASLREIERYTKAAEQEKLARAAITRLIKNG
ncbi:site-specific integrase [Terricaulis sp.]|uniref:tyrosine-type recombinase/integrase n=1 Tax=Terricaulis sp. TaxID=2768686 RepID=UPI002AC41A05|nr:site-specific integrase [Terricaulis sp.]MDZ4691304.1 site-specific integrase [Terricaulis sp.]